MVRVLGGGPAGASAAIAAALDGCGVEIIERSRFPRHKVCGEFLSPSIIPLLDRLGVLRDFEAYGPSRVRRMEICIGRRSKMARLDEPAFGLSRYAFDHILWKRAIALGAVQVESGRPDVIACGRSASARQAGNRIFGFKAHFEGPVSDSIELFFFDRAYVGINCIENDRTNVCGLASEDLLKQVGFEPDVLLQRFEPLKTRQTPLRQITKWLFAGPLEFSQHWSNRDAYYAGDALSFVDPFTGSGLLCAVLSGATAGACAARGTPVESYLGTLRYEMEEPYLYASILRRISASPWAERLLPLAPGRLLFRLTRP